MTRLWTVGARLVVAFALLAIAGEALARVGGGEGFSSGRGGGHSGGSGGGGGDGGGELIGDLIYFLIWLVIHHPTIGIPVVLLIAAVFIASQVGRRLGPARHFSHSDAPVRAAAPAPKRVVDPLARVRAVDPAFSAPVLLDQLQVVFRRSFEAAVSRQWGPLSPFVGEGVRASLERDLGGASGVTGVSEVVLASITFRDGARGVPITAKGPPHDVVVVQFDGTRKLATTSGERREYFVEEWQFVRPPGVKSQTPEAAHRLGCPSCGNAIDVDPMGRCRSCDTPIADGRNSWLAAVRTVISPPRPVSAPDVARSSGGAEPGYAMPTVSDPDLGRGVRGLQGRHPEFSLPGFEKKVKDVFTALQATWSEGRWEGARPYVTDTLFQTLRFWMDGYTKAGLTNRLDDVRIENVKVVKVEQDAWYEAVTVRIWASCKDYVADKEGRVVGGNADVPRKFSEYWTFLRTAGKPMADKPVGQCPSCGAALDRVGETGVCGYCDARITSGDHDWVLSRIEQAEVYRG